MKSKMISSLVLAGMVAFGAQAEDFSGSLFIKDATIAPGGTATLSVQLTNNIDINGFQFKMTLPTGISYTSWSLSEERLPSGATTSDCVKSQSFVNQVFSCASALNYGDTPASFTGTEGEIALVTITADASLAEGSYTINLTEIDVASSGGTDYDVPSTSFTLTVGAISYDEGYAVEVLPFAFKEDVDISLTMDNLTAITNIALDVELPKELVETEDFYYFDNYPGNSSKFNVNYDSNTDGSLHVTIDRRSKNKFNAGSGTNVAILGLTYDGIPLSAGVYPIAIKNIQLTDVDGNTYLAAPYTTEIFVGTSPKITVTNGVAAFHGNYGGTDEYALLTAALPESATIDLTEVSALADDPSSMQMNNVYVTADDVSYSRTVTSEWGSLCLPFAVETNDNIQLYELVAATSTSLTFEKVASAVAGTPLIFKASEGFSFKVANDGFNVGFAADDRAPQLNTNVDKWVINGSYFDESIDVSSMQAYALNGGEFHKVLSKLNVKAFHAWLQNNGTANAPAFRIFDGTEGIQVIEQEDGSVKLIYDLQGRMLKSGEHQQMYIENGKKIMSINK